MKVVVTGAAGMIGANLLRGLNAIGVDDIVAVDDLSDGAKYANLAGASISDYFDRRDFYARFERGELGRVDAVFHEGACSDTMEHDGRLMLDLNYRASKTLLDACQAQRVRLLYASSAAVYGGSATFREEPEFERPLNVYGYSKLLFDNVVRRMLADGDGAGRRLSLLQRLRPARAAQGPDGVGRVPSLQPVEERGPRQAVRPLRRLRRRRAGARFRLRRRRRRRQPLVPRPPRGERHLQRRQRPRPAVQRRRRGGRQRGARGRGDAALSLAEIVAAGQIEYIDFPPALVGKYQCFTQADLSRLRDTGCGHAFADVASGVGRYAAALRPGP